MKHLKSYNESIFGDISRLSKTRSNNDNKAIEIFKEIIKDFEENGMDLKKVKIIDSDSGRVFPTIKLLRDGRSLDIGRNCQISYLFGKYHPIYNDHHVGNAKAGKRLIKISILPFSIVFRKNSSEKMLNTDRIKSQKIELTDVSGKIIYIIIQIFRPILIESLDQLMKKGT